MPEWVQDENKWKKAIDAFKKQHNKKPTTDSDYALVTSIYKKMGGKIDSEAFAVVDGILQECEKMNTIKELLKEGMSAVTFKTPEDAKKAHKKLQAANITAIYSGKNQLMIKPEDKDKVTKILSIENMSLSERLTFLKESLKEGLRVRQKIMDKIEVKESLSTESVLKERLI